MQQTPSPIHVRIAHADPLLQLGLKSALGHFSELDISEPDYGEADPLAHWPCPLGDARVLIADHTSGIDHALRLRELLVPRGGKRPAVLVLTSCASEVGIRAALESGVTGYLLTGCSADELATAVRSVARGGRHLATGVGERLAESMINDLPTEREVEVLRLMAMGLGNKAIALELCISVGTVKTHVKALMQKLGAATRTEAAATADRRGLLDREGHSSAIEVVRFAHVRHTRAQPRAVMASPV
ncbi:MAG TPA: response regulator transcription factor [Burkholderiaceae bacterium]